MVTFSDGEAILFISYSTLFSIYIFGSNSTYYWTSLVVVFSIIYMEISL
jgi:hypothetical protein